MAPQAILPVKPRAAHTTPQPNRRRSRPSRQQPDRNQACGPVSKTLWMPRQPRRRRRDPNRTSKYRQNAGSPSGTGAIYRRLKQFDQVPCVRLKRTRDVHGSSRIIIRPDRFISNTFLRVVLPASGQGGRRAPWHATVTCERVGESLISGVSVSSDCARCFSAA